MVGVCDFAARHARSQLQQVGEPPMRSSMLHYGFVSRTSWCDVMLQPRSFKESVLKHGLILVLDPYSSLLVAVSWTTVTFASRTPEDVLVPLPVSIDKR